jgi:hypothetical protein
LRVNDPVRRPKQSKSSSSGADLTATVAKVRPLPKIPALVIYFHLRDFTNPAEVRQGPRKGLRTLAGEDDLGMELLHALDEQQQKVTIVDPTAYQDILTAASRKAALQGQPSGLSASKMNASQFDALMALMEEYARNVPDQLAEGRIEQLNKAGRNIFFAWSGGINRSDPHYYRVQTASFLIELDTQDNANHIHSVWRDFAGGFGEDLLQQHYQASHQKKQNRLTAARRDA